MEENGHDPQATLEQPGNDTPVTTNKKRKPMAASAVQEQNGQATALEGGKSKRERKVGLLPTAAGDQKAVSFAGKIIQETTWSALKGRKLFSVNPDGSHPYLKLSKSSYYDLVTEEVVTSVPITTAQKVYRIKLL
jgi:hypothetical protein